ncbi:ORF13 [Ectromelia virus WH]|nr:ORF13 [Ectromelia virus WH]
MLVYFCVNLKSFSDTLFQNWMFRIPMKNVGSMLQHIQYCIVIVIVIVIVIFILFTQ